MSRAERHDVVRVVIRYANEGDSRALRLLAGLDCRPLPAGRLLLAEATGALRAAYSVEEGTSIADPFQRTEHLVEMLRAHAASGAQHLAAPAPFAAGLRRSAPRPA